MTKHIRHTLKVVTTKDVLFNLTNICVSSCGKYLFCVFNNLVNIVEIETGLIKHTLESEEEDISSILLSPNDEFLITAHQSSLLLKQWSNWKTFPLSASTRTQKCTRTWKALHALPIVTMSFDSSSVLLATSGSDNTTKIWDLKGQYCTHNLKGTNSITRCARFYPDVHKKQEIILGGDDGKLRVYDLNSSRIVGTLEGHFSVVTSFEYIGKDADRLLSASRDKVLILWNMINQSKLRTIPIFESIESIQLVPSLDNHVITMGNAGLLKLWNFETGRLVSTQDESESLKPPGSNKTDLDPCIVQSTRISTTTSSLALVTADESIVFIKLEPDLLSKVNANNSIDDEKLFHAYKQFIGNHGEILDLKFVDVEERLIAVATNSPEIKIYDLDNWDCKILKGHKDLVICLASYKDRTRKVCYLASSSKDSQIRVWKISNGFNEDKNGEESRKKSVLADYMFELVQVCQGHTQDVGALGFSRQSFSFLVSGSMDTTIKLWRIESDEKSGTKKGVARMNEKLSVGFTVKAHESDINCLCVSPNDKLIASASSDKLAKLWDSKDGSCLAVLRGHRRGIWALDFSTIDQTLATCSADATIKLWSISDFSCIQTFEGHNTSVLKVFFINNSTQLVSCASDGLLKLWNTKTSVCVSTFDEHDDKCWSLLLTENEEKVITGGADGKLVVWKDVTEEIYEEELEKREEIILQEQELENFVKEKKWRKALKLALVLNKPFRAYSIIKEILETSISENEKNREEALNVGRGNLEKTLQSLREDQIRLLLKYVCDWNTNTKYCYIAQTVYELIFRTYPPEVLCQGEHIDLGRQLVEQFLPYTERHYARINRLAQQVSFVDFLWNNMKLEELKLSNGDEKEKDHQHNNDNSIQID